MHIFSSLTNYFSLLLSIFDTKYWLSPFTVCQHFLFSVWENISIYDVCFSMYFSPPRLMSFGFLWWSLFSFASKCYFRLNIFLKCIPNQKYKPILLCKVSSNFKIRWLKAFNIYRYEIYRNWRIKGWINKTKTVYLIATRVEYPRNYKLWCVKI